MPISKESLGYNRGYGICILSDCVEGWREETAAALEHVRLLAHAEIISTPELASVFERCKPYWLFAPALGRGSCR